MKGVSRRRAALIAAFMGCGLAGCDEEERTVEDRACEMAAEQIESCFGEGSADAFLVSCGPNDAARVDGRDCLDLTTVLLDDKADSTWNSAVLEAIRDALREALEQGLSAALQQVLARLGGVSAQDYGGYLLLEQTESLGEAETAAKRWAEDLQGRPGFDPIVVEYSSGYGVAHAPCIIGLDDVLPSMVADLVMGSPDTIEVLGGEVHQPKETESDREIAVSLPLVLLPQPRDTAKHPDCR